MIYVDSSGNNPVVGWLILYLGTLLASPDLPMDVQFIADDLAQGDYGAAALDTLGAAVPGLGNK